MSTRNKAKQKVYKRIKEYNSLTDRADELSELVELLLEFSLDAFDYISKAVPDGNYTSDLAERLDLLEYRVKACLKEEDTDV